MVRKESTGSPARAGIAVLVACLSLGAASGASAQDVVAVLSSDLGPYREALEGFRSEYGRPVPALQLTDGTPPIGPETRLVVAFGGKAALAPYPAGVALVYCMAPGTEVDAAERRAPTIEVPILPRPEVVLAKLAELQPGLRLLAIFWISSGVEPYVERMAHAAAQFGIEVRHHRLEHAADLPDLLRRLAPGADALWLPPDPLLINAESFSILKEFSWSNDVPFYVPTAGLVEKGAVASVSCSFRDLGRAAAVAARQVLAGKLMPEQVYPERSDTTVNLTAAANTGLRTPVAALRKADRVLP